MKTKIIYSVLAVLGWCLTVYLVVSFIEAGFDATAWPKHSRAGCGLLVLFPIMAALAKEYDPDK